MNKTSHASTCLPVVASLFVGVIFGAPPDPLVWDSPSADHHGSLPLGNGDISLNAWVEPSGELLFYIGKSDSWGDNARLLKLGKLRLQFDPAPPVTAPFCQELSFGEGTMHVRYADGTTLKLWVDAKHPAIEVECHTPQDSTATAVIELWRNEQKALDRLEVSDVLNSHPAPVPPTIVEPDRVLEGLEDRIGWLHHNIKSVGPAEHAAVQNMQGVLGQDPLLHRTFGALVTSSRPQRLDSRSLRSATGTSHRFSIHVLTRHPATPDSWLAAIQKQAAETGAIDFDQRYVAHREWWESFWSRSWLRASSDRPAPPAPLNQLPFRTGADQHGASLFTGKIREVSVAGDFADDFTLEAEVNPDPQPFGRLFDKITPGVQDGFLLDFFPAGTLRLIIGSEQFEVANPLPPGEWSRLRLDVAGGHWSVEANEVVVMEADLSAARDPAAHTARMAAMQRYLTACAGRGAFPIKFNGSLFTVPAADAPGDADYRRWGPGYWWQNTRLPYTSLCASGDFEMLEPLFRMYADQLLPYNMERTRRYFGFENAAYFPECVHFWGDVFNEAYGWTPLASERQDPLQTSGYHKHEWVCGLELVWMMWEAYEFTGDENLLRERLLPTASAIIRFFDQYYQTNPDGKLEMHPAQAVETWWDCADPMPELAGLHAILAKLLSLPDSLLPDSLRVAWATFAAKLPSLPMRDTPDGPAFAPARIFRNKRNIENPELYAVFPFRLCAFEKKNLAAGLRAFEHRWDKRAIGWYQTEIFSAYLGLAEETASTLSARARAHDPRERFPAFWGPNFDWTPDQDHGGVLVKALQSMLVQWDGEKIFLLPAWPKDWDADFKLHAPHKTTIEGIVKEGRITKLNVQPSSRRQDVIVAPGWQLQPSNHRISEQGASSSPTPSQQQ